MSHSAENLRRGKSFSVSLMWGIEKLWIRVGEGVSRFSVEKFLSHSAESFRRGESSSVSLIWFIGKVWIRGGGEYQDFPSKNFCLTLPKYSGGGTPLVFH